MIVVTKTRPMNWTAKAAPMTVMNLLVKMMTKFSFQQLEIIMIEECGSFRYPYTLARSISFVGVDI